MQEETDDEMLLSPAKKHRTRSTTKRAPPNTPQESGSYKRARRDDVSGIAREEEREDEFAEGTGGKSKGKGRGSNSGTATVTNTRGSNARPKRGRGRGKDKTSMARAAKSTTEASVSLPANAVTSNKKSLSSDAVYPPWPPTPTANDTTATVLGSNAARFPRAQSVPLFPSTYDNAHEPVTRLIDFHKVQIPRSPSKTNLFKIHSPHKRGVSVPLADVARTESMMDIDVVPEAQPHDSSSKLSSEDDERTKRAISRDGSSPDNAPPELQEPGPGLSSSAESSTSHRRRTPPFPSPMLPPSHSDPFAPTARPGASGVPFTPIVPLRPFRDIGTAKRMAAMGSAFKAPMSPLTPLPVTPFVRPTVGYGNEEDGLESGLPTDPPEALKQQEDFFAGQPHNALALKGKKPIPSQKSIDSFFVKVTAKKKDESDVGGDNAGISGGDEIAGEGEKPRERIATRMKARPGTVAPSSSFGHSLQREGGKAGVVRPNRVVRSAIQKKPAEEALKPLRKSFSFNFGASKTSENAPTVTKTYSDAGSTSQSSKLTDLSLDAPPTLAPVPSETPPLPEQEQEPVPPGSPMQIALPKGRAKKITSSIFIPKTSATAKGKAPASARAMPPPPVLTSNKRSAKPVSEASPSKVPRPSTSFGVNRNKPVSIATSNPRSLTLDTLTAAPMSGPSSSLSNLANTLDDLTMALSSRPNTSLCFSRELEVDEGGDEGGVAKDDSVMVLEETEKGEAAKKAGPRKSIGALKRSNSAGVGVPVFANNAKAKPPAASSSSSSALPSFMRPTKASAGLGVNPNATARTVPQRPNDKPRLFGTGAPFAFGMGKGRPNQKASKLPGLPMVVGSPVKGGDPSSFDYDEVGVEGGSGDMMRIDGLPATSPANGPLGDVFVTLGEDGTLDKGKGKEKDKTKKDASRRASLALQALSQSLSVAPQMPVSSMGPPTTPGRNSNGGARSVSSSYPASVSPSKPSSIPSSSSATSVIGRTTGPGMSSSTRSGGVRTAPGALDKIKGGINGHISSKSKGKEKEAEKEKLNPAIEALKVLRECTIFVDVRTEDGDDAGGLFVDMLKGLGAKIPSRVGQNCTHIVYKNGLMSTLTRYRLLKDPKPTVVGIAWVVECVEQRALVSQSKFRIDLEKVNIAGASNKRRRSMIPKHILGARALDDDPPSSDGGDVDNSLNGSTSSIGDDLPPLERARRRRSLMPTAQT